MWVSKGEAIARAPTPPGFENMAQKLEDGDSVLFQSISIPSAPSVPDVEVAADNLHSLEARLHEMEFAEAQEDIMIRQKDAQIAALEHRLVELQRRRGRPKAASATVSSYKGRYEHVLMKLQSLKAALNEAGKVRSVPSSSARAVQPTLV
jgi:DNA repair exonuclease SbcCD ATPase subunit